MNQQPSNRDDEDSVVPIFYLISLVLRWFFFLVLWYNVFPLNIYGYLKEGKSNIDRVSLILS